MEISLRQVACITGLGKEAEVGELQLLYQGSPAFDQGHVGLPSKMRIDEEKPGKHQAGGQTQKKNIRFSQLSLVPPVRRFLRGPVTGPIPLRSVGLPR